MRPIRLLVADEHALFWAAIAAAINGNGTLTVVDESTDGPSADERPQTPQPDRLLIMSEAPDQAVPCANESDRVGFIAWAPGPSRHMDERGGTDA